MQIQRFSAKKIHGYLNFDVKFDNEITFLTGINGSGKTSVIQSIIALITPNFYVLTKMNFEKIEVFILDNEVKISISAKMTKDGAIVLNCSSTKDQIIIRPYSHDPDLPSYSYIEKEQEYYSELLDSFSETSLMRVINELPTPMFLDLDRRPKDLPDRRIYSMRRTPIRRGRNIFSDSLSLSMSVATSLAQNSYRDALINLGTLGEKLRESMILELLELEPSPAYGLQIKLPTKKEIETITTMRKSIESLPQILQIDKVDLEKRLIPTLDTLTRFAERIPKDFDVETLFKEKNGELDQEILDSILGWSSNEAQLKNIIKIVKLVGDYNEQRKQRMMSYNKYISTINKFINDSEKTLYFDDQGYLWFSINGLDEKRPISSLSSGEAQLFVILTHLFFNPKARKANVFIIDEPELSLHVHWQELFVDSVISANPNIQYIMATHAPSIIRSRLDNCIDLSKPNKRGIRG